MCKEQLEFDIGVIKYYEFTISINMSYDEACQLVSCCKIRFKISWKRQSDIHKKGG